ncbi:tryptophan synthase subunit alpha [Metabacillus iocasae]|uniref:Tryptophan synthase alpha chain n=1 Tax=Priestia iocasae TaxID=2291674 RepID=A0ABS2QSI8_9BACI|nr:tryptophan synthase subunit alpha [Metabacillus iocasae]MBM7701731.1 tryptophan synthase alpha chain [Metabacillus iocasae]
MSNTFQKRLPHHDKLFIPFITAGDPSADATVELALSLQKSGASVLELGVPYSDPLADGPIIQEASKRALDGGMSIRKAMSLVPEMRKKGLKIPVILFTYFNPVLQLGLESFFALVSENELDGVLIPDLPYEESEQIRTLASTHGVAYISMVAPTSKERIRKIAKDATGFLYCVSSLGVTGVRTTLPTDINEFLEEVKAHTSIPVAVGFGISTKEQVNLLKDYTDGIVIGSAIVNKVGSLQDLLLNEQTRDQAIREFEEYVTSIVLPIQKCEV